MGRLPAGSLVSLAKDVTADGNVVVGDSLHHVTQFFAPAYLPFRWTREATVQKLGQAESDVKPHYFETAAAISAAGTKVAGSLFTDAFILLGNAFVWALGSPTSVLLPHH